MVRAKKLVGGSVGILLVIVCASISYASITEDIIHGVTTLVVASTPDGQSQGTGFFYQEQAPFDPTQGEYQWINIYKLWLVTNRHVLLPKIRDSEVLPSSVAFHLRRQEEEKLVWEPIVVSQDELIKRARFHRDSKVDIAIIDVLGLLKKHLESGGKFLPWHGLTKSDFPEPKQISVAAADDVIVIGYPRSFYDRTQLFPIVKLGVIASKWGSHFNGQPYFLIDAKLFPGSSGSLVISKPRDVAVISGELKYSKEKNFAFLGVYSGEPFQYDQRPIELENMVITQKLGFNVGIVWYGNLVEEIIQNGQAYR